MYAVVGIIVAAFLAIILIVTRPSGTKTTVKPAMKLPDYATRDSSVSITTEGRLVGQDKFRSIRITVDANERTIEILSGYEKSVERSETFSNTQQAYDTFLRALNNAGFMKTKTASYPDERGVCPLGYRYLYDLKDDNKSALHTWSANCGNIGSFAGAGTTVRQLFQAQISSYNTFTSGVLQ